MPSTTQETPASAPAQAPDRKLGPPDTILWRWSDDPVEETTSAGGCHCGAVRFRFRHEVLTRQPGYHCPVKDCNCSICVKNGYLFVYPQRQQIVWISGEGALVDYRFATGKKVHRFCGRCGSSICMDMTGSWNEWAGDVVAMNVCMLDDFDVDVLNLQKKDGKSFAKPYAYSFPRSRTALLIIDMQRGFLLEDGLGEIQGGNLSAVQAFVKPARKLLETSRAAGLAIFHTREGHLPDMSDCPSSKVIRQTAAPENTQHMLVVGNKGKMGRLLVCGKYGHDIVDEVKPIPGEVVIDKAGKGAFWNTVLMHKLKVRGITHLILAGVTTECCVTTHISRGKRPRVRMLRHIRSNSRLQRRSLQDRLFGFVASLQPLLDVLRPLSPNQTLLNERPSSPLQTPPEWDGDLRISSLQQAYRAGLSPVNVIEALYSKIAAYETVNPGAWIHLVPKDVALAAAQDLTALYPDRSALPPLFGIPFTVEDSIDVASLPTTTACPPLSHIPSVSAPIYSLVISGALILGKVNLDQLATGLSGYRSPYGTCSSVSHPAFISGGSSSGSAVTVGAHLASFSLATDTAGSDRVPALFNGIVGFTRTRGTVPFSGRRSRTFDPRDPYAKPPLSKIPRPVHSIGPQATTFSFGIPPPEALAVLSPPYHCLFLETVAKLQSIGGQLREIDSLRQLHPVIAEFFTSVLARTVTPADVFRGLQTQPRLTALVRNTVSSPGEGGGVDVVVVPTAPTHFTRREMEADPIGKNGFLGTFTHSGNVLDLCAVACPAGEYEAKELGLGEEEGRLPFGVTFLRVGGGDAEVLEIAGRFEEVVGRE
ncbi:amidase signature domain-containing protein [Coniochaeta sp. 2T2.1]|nr:amidase signature domain-containing protein [Coniochaeta sp. 2T2.1]